MVFVVLELQVVVMFVVVMLVLTVIVLIVIVAKLVLIVKFGGVGIAGVDSGDGRVGGCVSQLC